MAIRLIFTLFLASVAIEGLTQVYQEGYFYTIDDKKVIGKIKFTGIQSGYLTPSGSVPGHIKIKTDQEAKAIQVTADEMRGFVMGVDSFVVLKNIPISFHDHFRRDFVKVEIMGDLNLYVHYRQVQRGRFGSETKKVFIVRRKESRKLVAFHTSDLKERFISMISEDEALATEVRGSWFWFDRIPEYVQRYNNRNTNLHVRKN